MEVPHKLNTRIVDSHSSAADLVLISAYIASGRAELVVMSAPTGGGAGLAAGTSSTGLYSGIVGASSSARELTSLGGAMFCPSFSNTKYTGSYKQTTTNINGMDKMHHSVKYGNIPSTVILTEQFMSYKCWQGNKYSWLEGAVYLVNTMDGLNRKILNNQT